MNNYIVSVGTANPGKAISQENISKFMKNAHGLDHQEGRKLDFIYKRSGIQSRHSVLTDFEKEEFQDFTFFPKNKELNPFPSTKSRMEVYRKAAPKIALAAIEDCLSGCDAKVSSISHLIVISCTGMYAPGLEIDLINSLGMKNSVERYAIQFMGCYAAFSGLKMADRICDSDPNALVLVVAVELCTLHFQKDYNEDNLLSNAIFGDGAAAVLVSKKQQGIKIKDYQSNLFQEGENDMAWSIGDFGFEMKLSKYIPGLLEKGIQSLKKDLEKRFSLSEIKNFAIHPGGIQILNKVEQTFQIHYGQNRHAHEVLKNYGNMSSVTILFVIKAIMNDPTLKGDVLAMGFGPGLTLETMLLDKI